jgi:iron complex outermembrane receptor protein
MLAAPAAAQSTGSVEFEESEIIVTGAFDRSVGGVEIPDTPKAKQVLDEEIIRRQRPGQTVNDIVNLVPGVSFQNNDPWGSSGGGFTIRGFGSDRISQTIDGIPLNDSGNYALYTNQQVDPEVLEQVSVNLGVTDVDSPTASAVGGTINIRTRTPDDELGLMGSLSYGDILAEGSGSRPYHRVFGMIDTGDITGAGTKAYVSASLTRYDNPFNNYGKVRKQQYNGKIHQDLGGNGDFVAIAGHYNQNRNNFFGSLPLRADPALDAGSSFGNRFPLTREERFYEINYPCSVASIPGVFETPEQVAAEGYDDPDGVNGCGAEFDRRWNPSNTGNIRGSSRFTLMDGLVLTVDPSYQYVKANGGGNEELLEGTREYNGQQYTGFLRGGYYFGRDLNGDGDMLDEVSGHDPSQTRTHRYGVISSLAYDINDQHRVRLAYTWDRADHRQTGQTSIAFLNGDIMDVFPINDPLETADGFALSKRNRQSYAILHQVSGEYRGRFMDDRLTAVLGLRAPFFTRELDQRCYTTSASGFLDCFENQDTAAYEATNPNAAPPQERTYKYDELLPNVGFTFDVTGDASIFANYAKGISVPGTDPLYASLFFPDTEEARPNPETTDSFDLGVRMQSGNVQAQLAGWFTRYNDRLASAYDPVLDEVIYRNLGRVDKYGLDASVAWHPTPNTLLYVFGSLNESEIKDNVVTEDGVLETAGKRESGAPVFTVGARGQVALGPVEFGAQIKHTGKRYVNDENLARPAVSGGFPFEDIGYPAAVDGYTLVDLDVRWNVAEYANGRNVALQLNLSNVFDELYVGNFNGGPARTHLPFAQIGAPRAGSISLIFGY